VNVSSPNMKLLLDECIPRRLRLDFPGHEVHTVEQAGLKGLKNGALLRMASGRFDVLITVDQNLPFQQARNNQFISVLILIAPSNRYFELRRLIQSALEALVTIKPGDILTIP
jgi:predicted nuclease of predicted toxin-antitoxin system